MIDVIQRRRLLRVRAAEVVKLVILIADVQSLERGRCDMGLETIAAETGTTRSGANRALRFLRGLPGFVEDGQPGGATHRRVALDELLPALEAVDRYLAGDDAADVLHVVSALPEPKRIELAADRKGRSRRVTRARVARAARPPKGCSPEDSPGCSPENSPPEVARAVLPRTGGLFSGEPGGCSPENSKKNEEKNEERTDQLQQQRAGAREGPDATTGASAPVEPATPAATTGASAPVVCSDDRGDRAIVQVRPGQAPRSYPSRDPSSDPIAAAARARELGRYPTSPGGPIMMKAGAEEVPEDFGDADIPADAPRRTVAKAPLGDLGDAQLALRRLVDAARAGPVPPADRAALDEVAVYVWQRLEREGAEDLWEAFAAKAAAVVTLWAETTSGFAGLRAPGPHLRQWVPDLYDGRPAVPQKRRRKGGDHIDPADDPTEGWEIAGA